MVLRFLAFLMLVSPTLASAGPELPCAKAAHDNDVFWLDGLGHNSFDTNFRAPFGAVTNDQSSVALRFRTCLNDVDQVRVRVWNSAEKREDWYNMSAASGATADPTLGPLQYWDLKLPVPGRPTILYYLFEITDGKKIVYYSALNPRFVGGGWGKFSAAREDENSYQLTVYDKALHVPTWLKGANIYQVFPDRFRNGDKSNDPADGVDSVYGAKIRKLDWKEPLCDTHNPSAGCLYQADNQFYGGDLQGVIDKLDYLKDLGVDVIYLNPIFQAASVHRYDTQDYFKIDRYLGDLKLWDRLVAEANARGIRLLIDGVFNHVSADSQFFDLYHRYGDRGACQSTNSPYRDWFFLRYRNDWNKARDVTGRHESVFYYCAGAGYPDVPYDAWAGYFQLPGLNWGNPEVKNFFYASGSKSVGPYWIGRGASGWRLDVGGLLDRGQGEDPSNTIWEDFRTALKAQNPDAVVIGEEWGNGSPWVLGREWDSVMNYRFRNAMLNWMFDSCSGNGCADGKKFSDTNTNDWNYSGSLGAISEQELDLRLKTIQENYPSESWNAMMNLVASHDTSRVRFLLKKISNGDDAMGRRKLQFIWLFEYTYPGAPTVYYGDEAGLANDDDWADGTWVQDPFNRAVYPWEDEGLTPDKDLIAQFKKIANLRHAYPVLRSGDFTTLLADRSDAGRHIYAFRRSAGGSVAIVVLNRGAVSSGVSVPVGTIADGTRLEDVLNGGTFVVAGGKVELKDVPGLSGRVLILKK